MYFDRDMGYSTFRMIRKLRTVSLLFISILWTNFLLGACSPESPTLSPEPTVIVTEQPTEVVPPTQSQDEAVNSTSYAIVRIPRDERLVIRQPAGQSGTEVGYLEWNAKNVQVTGNRTLLGSSLWREIQFGIDGLGWVNSLNIPEAISADDFCSDQRVIDLLNALRTVIEEENDVGLAKFLNNDRGLSIRLNWYSPDIRFTVEEARDLFSNPDEIEWGVMADSGLIILGTFREVMFPKLEDVFLRAPEATCNALKYGSTAGKIIWPQELTNLKFYGIYRSSESDGNEFDWRSWAVGIEYADGNPYIAVLIHYSSEL
jgi:hypothetical protein